MKDNIGVLKPFAYMRLVPEHLDKFFLGSKVRQDAFNAADAIKPIFAELAGHINFGHAAACDLLR